MKILDNANRETNFELLRIISMIMVIILHFNNFGHILEYGNDYSIVRYYIFEVIEYVCIIAVNLYVLISRYFMIKSKISLKKIIRLELQVLFYSFFIYIILLITNQIEFNTGSFIKSIFPTVTGQYWFITAYFGLYILIPFINKLLNSLSAKDYKNLIIILTIIFSVVGCFFPSKSIFEVSGGYSLIWFIYIYMLAGYIRLHFDFSKKYKIIGEITKLKLFVAYILILILQLAIFIIYNKYFSANNMLLLGINQPLILINSILVFLIFKKITIKNNIVNKIINSISPLTLAIYLIHQHPEFFDILWNKILRPFEYIDSYKIFVVFVVDVTLIFVVCCCIENVRKIIFKKISSLNFVKSISDKIERKAYIVD